MLKFEFVKGKTCMINDYKGLPHFRAFEFLKSLYCMMEMIILHFQDCKFEKKCWP